MDLNKNTKHPVQINIDDNIPIVVFVQADVLVQNDRIAVSSNPERNPI